MDLSTLLPADSAPVVILHPTTNEPTDIVINMFGQDSAAYKNAIKERARIQMAEKKKPVDLDEAERKGIALVAAATAGWSGITENGKTIEFSQAAAVYIYTKYIWIREQAEAAIYSRANFLPSA